jgi:hypothetical protein
MGEAGYGKRIGVVGSVPAGAGVSDDPHQKQNTLLNLTTVHWVFRSKYCKISHFFLEIGS